MSYGECDQGAGNGCGKFGGHAGPCDDGVDRHTAPMNYPVPTGTCRYCLKPEHPSGTICSQHPDLIPVGEIVERMAPYAFTGEPSPKPEVADLMQRTSKESLAESYLTCLQTIAKLEAELREAKEAACPDCNYPRGKHCKNIGLTEEQENQYIPCEYCFLKTALAAANERIADLGQAGRYNSDYSKQRIESLESENEQLKSSMDEGEK